MKWSPVALNMYQRPRRTPKMSLKWTLAKGTRNAPQHHRTAACECVTKVACMTHMVISNRCHSSADKLWRRHYRKWGLTGLYSSCHLRWTWREHENNLVSLQISIIRLMWLFLRGWGRKEGKRAQFLITLFLSEMIYPMDSHWQKN